MCVVVKLLLWQVQTCPSVNFMGLVASIFGPISCSGSGGRNMAGMTVAPLTQSVIDWDQSDVTA